MSTQYKVFFTPQINMNTYGREIDVSEKILLDGVDQIKSSIDSTDYAIGVFTFGDIQLKAFNFNGYFNTNEDYRSIFKYSRDKCKVRVVFSNDEGDTITYKGLINDKATSIDAASDTISFRVLSLDSIIGTLNVPGGTIGNGVTVQDALASLLDVPEITSVLNFDILNINPGTEFTIDNGAAFDDQSKKVSINNLLIASNSVMLIDDDENIIIKDRQIDFDLPVFRFYGPYDIYGRENVIGIQNFNTGHQRQFTGFNINGVEEDNTPLIETYGFTRADFTFDFITDPAKAGIIASGLLAEFAAPKMELELIVATSVARDLRILDVCSINWPLRISPSSQFMPVVGITKVGSAIEKLPYVFGSFQIIPNVGFKIIEITENPKDFTMVLKLRQIGTTLSDGVFNPKTSSIVGIAVVGVSKVRSGTTDPWNPSVVGAAKVSFTKVAV